jgi:hypothetical protein
MSRSIGGMVACVPPARLSTYRELPTTLKNAGSSRVRFRLLNPFLELDPGKKLQHLAKVVAYSIHRRFLLLVVLVLLREPNSTYQRFRLIYLIWTGLRPVSPFGQAARPTSSDIGSVKWWNDKEPDASAPGYFTPLRHSGQDRRPVKLRP